MIRCVVVDSANHFLPRRAFHNHAFVGEPPAAQPKLQVARLLMLKGVEKYFPGLWEIPFSVSFWLVRFPVIGLEMGFEKTQRVNSRAALFADRGALFGLAHGNFLEHGCE
jgi:hypothetical protein